MGSLYNKMAESSARRIVTAIKALDACNVRKNNDDTKETIGKLRTVLVKLLEYYRWHMAEDYKITKW